MGDLAAVLGRVPGREQTAERVADEGERLAQPQGVDRAIERGDVLLDRVRRVLGHGRLAEPEQVDRDAAIPWLEQGHEPFERRGG
jgi:hypothetical protein